MRLIGTSDGVVTPQPSQIRLGSATRLAVVGDEDVGELVTLGGLKLMRHTKRSRWQLR